MKRLLLAGQHWRGAYSRPFAQAQTDPYPKPTAESAAPGETAQGEGGLGAEIIITAQRREESLSARDRRHRDGWRRVTQAGVTQATELTRLVRLQVAPASSFSQFYLRGVGTFAANAFAEQGVAFNLDGVYLSRPAAPSGLFYDLARIEVFKGPQGTLYGRNATGGAVNVITNRPELAELGGFSPPNMAISTRSVPSGAVNLPLGAQLALACRRPACRA